MNKWTNESVYWKLIHLIKINFRSYSRRIYNLECKFTGINKKIDTHYIIVILYRNIEKFFFVYDSGKFFFLKV